MKRFPASTSRSAIPTARIPAPIGTPRLTSMWWAASSISGSMGSRSCAEAHSSLIPSLRQKFNSDWTREKYLRFLQLLEQRGGGPPQFRHSETPVFLPADLVDRMAQYGREMVEQLLANAD